MESIQSFTNNQQEISSLNIFPLLKESRHGKHREGYIRPEFRTLEGRKKWNERSLVGMKKLRTYRKSLKPKLTLEVALQKKGWALSRYWNCLDKPHARLAYDKGNKACYLPKWNERLEPKPISEILIENKKNAVLILHNKKYDKPIYYDNNVGEIDIDVRGYTALFPKTAYNSRKIGSVKILFLYKKRDMTTKYWQQNQKLGVNCKFDFKVSGHSYVAGSTHESGDLYDLKRYLQPFFINNNRAFSSASEAYKSVIHTIKKFEQAKELKAMKLQNQVLYTPLLQAIKLNESR